MSFFSKLRQLRVGIPPNHTDFDTNGHQTMNGSATTFEDLRLSVLNFKLPTSNAPEERDYAFGIGAGVTYKVLGFALNEHAYLDIQTPHAMKLNTELFFHLHFILPNTTDVGHKFRFQLDVVAAGADGTFAVPTGSPFTADHTVAANDNTNHRILGGFTIPAVNTTVSTIYKLKLTRVAVDGGDTEYGSEVYLLYADPHYEADSLGSNTEYGK